MLVLLQMNVGVQELQELIDERKHIRDYVKDHVKLLNVQELWKKNWFKIIIRAIYMYFFFWKRFFVWKKLKQKKSNISKLSIKYSPGAGKLKRRTSRAKRSAARCATWSAGARHATCTTGSRSSLTKCQIWATSHFECASWETKEKKTFENKHTVHVQLRQARQVEERRLPHVGCSDQPAAESRLQRKQSIERNNNRNRQKSANQSKTKITTNKWNKQ